MDKLLEFEMAEPNCIKQAMSGYRREFTFGHEKLMCKLRDASGEREFQIPYEAIDILSFSTLTLNKTPITRRSFVAGLACIIGALFAASAALPGYVPAVLYAIGFLLFGAIMVNQWTGWLSATFTVMRLSPPPPGTNLTLMVLHDKNRDQVMAALTDSWKARLKMLYGRANPSSDHQKETDRLKWLLDKNIIDELHYHGEFARLTASDTTVGFTVTH